MTMVIGSVGGVAQDSGYVLSNIFLHPTTLGLFLKVCFYYF